MAVGEEQGPEQGPSFDIKPAVKVMLDQYGKSDVFKSQVEEMLASTRMELVASSERKARNWALGAAGLIFGIFVILAGLEYLEVRRAYLDIKSTEADIRVKYAEAVELIGTIGKQLSDLDTETEKGLEKTRGLGNKVGTMETLIKGYTSNLQGLQTQTQEISNQIKIFESQIQRIQKELEFKRREAPQ